MVSSLKVIAKSTAMAVATLGLMAGSAAARPSLVGADAVNKIYFTGNEANNHLVVNVNDSGSALTFKDTASQIRVRPSAKPQCDKTAPNGVSCALSGDLTLSLLGGQGKDSINLVDKSSVLVSAILDGGPGADTLSVGSTDTTRLAAVVRGRAGNDIIDTGNYGTDEVFCGAGYDIFRGQGGDTGHGCEESTVDP